MLDCGCRVMPMRPAHTTSPSSGSLTSQASDDDVKESDDSVDDGLEDGGDGVHNCHDAIADGAEDRFDTGYDGTHC